MEEGGALVVVVVVEEEEEGAAAGKDAEAVEDGVAGTTGEAVGAPT